MGKKYIIAVAMIIVLVGAGSFYGGMRYEKSKIGKQMFSRNQDSSSGNRQQGQQGMNRIGGRGNGNMEGGEIISKDDKSITVKTREGGSKIVYFSDSTTIGKMAEGSLSDLENGKQVMIMGKNNQDGTFAAESIQVRPENGMPQNQ